MITANIVNFLIDLASKLVAKLPDISATSDFGNAIITANGYIATAYSFLPVITVTLLAVIVFDILFEGGYFLYKIIYWIIRRFPTQS